MKIITTLLTDKLEGRRIYEIVDHPIKMIIVNKDDEDYVKNTEEIKQHCCYFLLSGIINYNHRRKLYIGQTQDGSSRFFQHLKKKEFWETAVFFISEKHLNRSEVQFLEYLAIKTAIECDCCNLMENCQIPKIPYLSTDDRIRMEDFFDDMRLLLDFAGYQIYQHQSFMLCEDEPSYNHHTIASRVAQHYVKKSQPIAHYSADDIYDDRDEVSITYDITTSSIKASGSIMEDGRFIVLPGTILSPRSTPSDIFNEYQKKHIIDMDGYSRNGFICASIEEATMIITGTTNVSLWRKTINEIY